MPDVLLLHGWPGDTTDWRAVLPRLDGVETATPELLWHPDPSAATLARLLVEEIDEPVVLGGYDVGSRVAQAIARAAPEKVRAMVLAPPLPGIGDRILSPDAQREFWYQPFHRLDLAEQLVDGRPDAVRAYLRHFWEHWSGPGSSSTRATSSGWSSATRRRAPSPRRSAGTAPARAPWR